MLTTLKGKLQELSEVDQTMVGILDDAKRASHKGDLTAEQREEFDIASGEFDNIIENLTAEERIEFAEMQLENAKGRRSAHETGKTFSPCKQSELMKKTVAGGAGKIDPSVIPGYVGGTSRVSAHAPSGNRFRDLFPVPISLGVNRWSSFDDFFAAVQSGRHHDDLEPAMLAATKGFDSAGGYFVPPEFTAELLDAALEDEIVRPRARVVPMLSDQKKVASFAHSDSSSSVLFGAYSGGWAGEATTATDQTPAVRQIELNAKKLFLYSTASRELLEDGESFTSQLRQAMIKSASWFLDDALLNGDGSNKPKGVLGDVAQVTVSKETGQAAATIVYPNLTKMFARLHPASMKNSVWVASSTTIPQLTQMSVDVGTGGSHIRAMSEVDGSFNILSRPVIFTEKLASVGTLNDIILVDFTQYLVGLRQEIVIDSSKHIGFASDTVAFRCILRVDGQGTWSAPYTPKTGSTQSWIVKLATRS